MYKRTFGKNPEAGCWSGYSWNPITGCQHGCEYCYARKTANFLYRYYTPGTRFDFRFHPNRFDAIQNTKIPNSTDFKDSLVFVGSMGDVFGDWVPRENIVSILNVIKDAPAFWTFAFLTKNPERLSSFEFPNNVWIGATVTQQSDVRKVEGGFQNVVATKKFICLEPLVGEVKFNSLENFDWMIIGPLSKGRKRYVQPKWEWVESLVKQAREYNVKIFFRPGLELPSGWNRLREYPIH